MTGSTAGIGFAAALAFAKVGVGDFVRQLAASRGISFEEMEREFFATARPSSLLRRFITVEEVANTIIYLVGWCAASSDAHGRTVHPERVG